MKRRRTAVAQQAVNEIHCAAAGLNAPKTKTESREDAAR